MGPLNRMLLFAAIAGVGGITWCGLSPSNQAFDPVSRQPYRPRTRVYYVAAEDIVWNYAPQGRDPALGPQLAQPWGARTVYRKQHYVQYADSTFQTPVPQPAWQGILGPIIRGVVGDTIKVVFFNKTTAPISIHPHGVRYAPADEGARYDPPRGGGDAVVPGDTYAYTWFVRPEAGPLPNELSSRVWLYHSHVRADHEIYRGLIGTIVITDPAHAREDATPDDVDREFTTLWMVFNENTATSHAESEEANLKHSINGYLFANLPGLVMNRGERVRWYVVSLGTEVDWHTTHWHGAVLRLGAATYTDVMEVGPAAMKVGDMVADNPGTWMLHCHVSDHMMGGMYALYTINDSTGTVAAKTPHSNHGP